MYFTVGHVIRTQTFSQVLVYSSLTSILHIEPVVSDVEDLFRLYPFPMCIIH
jgi:hypothetical protein